MEYTSIQSQPQDESSRRIRAIFRDIERKARLSGNTALLRELDRIPCLILGPSNRVPDGVLNESNTQAMVALERITEAFAAEEPPTDSPVH